VSIRSKDDIDIGVVAKTFGGGGHKNASGGMLDGPLEHVKSRVLGDVEKAIIRQLGSGGTDPVGRRS